MRHARPRDTPGYHGANVAVRDPDAGLKRPSRLLILVKKSHENTDNSSSSIDEQQLKAAFSTEVSSEVRLRG